MANAKISKIDHFRYKGGDFRFNYMISDQADVDFPFENSIDADTSDPGISVMPQADFTNELFSSLAGVFKFQNGAGFEIDYIGIIGAQSSVGTDTMNLRIMKPYSSQNSTSVESWVLAGDHKTTLSTVAVHGISSGDYVAIHEDSSGQNRLTAATSGSLRVSDGTHLVPVPVPVTEVTAADEFVINTPGMTVFGDSVGAVGTNDLTVYEVLGSVEIEITSTEKNIMIDVSAYDDDCVFVLEGDPTGTQKNIIFDRIMTGGFFQSARNIQPPIISPVNSAENVEMHNGDILYETANNRVRSVLFWKSLTKAETIIMEDLIDENLKYREIIFTAFPGDGNSDWERRKTIYGVIEEAEVTPFLNNGEYWSSVRLSISGVSFDEIYTA